MEVFIIEKVPVNCQLEKASVRSKKVLLSMMPKPEKIDPNFCHHP